MRRNNGNPLFVDDFNAWPSGPVIKDVYHCFMPYQDGPIRPIYNKHAVELSNDIKCIIYSVLQVTKDLDTLDLMNVTNIANGPWHKVYKEDDRDYEQVITKESIYNFYLNNQLFESTTKEVSIDNFNEKEFIIGRHKNSIILKKNNQEFEISQSSDDIYFSTSQKEINIELNLSSRNYYEWQTYIIFENLMKSIIGRYILNGDNQKEHSCLPKDFINLENKIITYHSDSDIDNILRLEYTDNKTIKITIQKCKDSKEHYTNSVRIRTSGSEYEYYYQEFLEFFKELLILEQSLNNTTEKAQSQIQEDKSQPKNLTRK